MDIPFVETFDIARASRFLPRMMRLIGLIVALFANACPAHAMVGGALPANDAASRAVVIVLGQRGNLCTGALIAPTLVLTAAHCVQGNSAMRVSIGSGPDRRTYTPSRVAMHPRYSNNDMARQRATADIALLQLAKPLDLPSIDLGVPTSFAARRLYRVIGSGVTRPDDGASTGTARSASLVATGKPGTLQIRLVDPATDNKRSGLGACTGDSGAPVFEDQNGRGVIVGVVSWSTAANNDAGCGGLTGVTPLTLYRDWIERIMKEWR